MTQPCPGIYLSRDQLLPLIYLWLQNRYESCTHCLAMARLEHTYIHKYIFPQIFRHFRQHAPLLPAYTYTIKKKTDYAGTYIHISILPQIFRPFRQHATLPSLYTLLQNCCLDINNSSLLVSVDMSHVPVSWQRPGWDIHISSDLSAPWAEWHTSPCLYSYNSPTDSYAGTYTHTFTCIDYYCCCFCCRHSCSWFTHFNLYVYQNDKRRWKM
jgi:hypothetical protein